MSEINDVMVKYGRYFLKRMLMKLASTMLCIDNTISLWWWNGDTEWTSCW